MPASLEIQSTTPSPHIFQANLGNKPATEKLFKGGALRSAASGFSLYPMKEPSLLRRKYLGLQVLMYSPAKQAWLIQMDMQATAWPSHPPTSKWLFALLSVTKQCWQTKIYYPINLYVQPSAPESSHLA